MVVIELDTSSEKKPTTAAEGYASDGFETASESDVINDDNDHHNNKDEEQITRDDDNDQSVPVTGEDIHPYHDSLTDDQIHQVFICFTFSVFVSCQFQTCIV